MPTKWGALSAGIGTQCYLLQVIFHCAAGPNVIEGHTEISCLNSCITSQSQMQLPDCESYIRPQAVRPLSLSQMDLMVNWNLEEQWDCQFLKPHTCGSELCMLHSQVAVSPQLDKCEHP